jgi:RNA polymerase sigma-70 factor (ECF subfamily)
LPPSLLPIAEHRPQTIEMARGTALGRGNERADTNSEAGARDGRRDGRRDGTEWAAILDRLMQGDRVAFLDTADLITGFLRQWRAYDFRDEWDDLIQEVILATLKAAQSGKLRNPAAVVGYFRTATRYKFVDWLRRRRLVELPPEEETSQTSLSWPPQQDAPEGAWEIWDAVRELPETHQQVIVAAYRDGMTHGEVARAVGIPQGSVSRLLREALAALRGSLEPGASG